jgi:hypothetical protein
MGEGSKDSWRDPSAVVCCPELNDGVLKVRDEVSAGDPTMMERYLVSDKCSASYVIRMRVPSAS